LGRNACPSLGVRISFSVMRAALYRIAGVAGFLRRTRSARCPSPGLY
jgi:hypothetical protein